MNVLGYVPNYKGTKVDYEKMDTAYNRDRRINREDIGEMKIMAENRKAWKRRQDGKLGSKLESDTPNDKRKEKKAEIKNMVSLRSQSKTNKCNLEMENNK